MYLSQKEKKRHPEYEQYIALFEETITQMESGARGRGAPEAIIERCLDKALEFYDADSAALVETNLDLGYIKVIRRYSRQILNASEVERRHLVSIPDLDYENLESLNNLEDSVDIGSGLVQEMYRRYLEEALSWLPSRDARLIEAIYFDCIPMTKIAEMCGVTEGTIRYHRNRIIAKLKIILEDVMHLSRDILPREKSPRPATRLNDW